MREKDDAHRRRQGPLALWRCIESILGHLSWTKLEEALVLD